MKKQTTLHSIKLLSLAIVAAIIIGTSFSVSAQQPKPVLKDRLVKVLQDKSLSKEQITSIIKKNGVDFELTGEVETELRNAGADNTIVEAARNNYRGEALLTDDQTDTTAAKPDPVKKKGMFGKLAEGVGKAANKTKETMSKTPASKEQESSPDESAAQQNNSSVACPASDPDSDGKTTNEKTFRGVIRRLWEKEAEQGSDGAVTITFQRVVVGAPRAWRPTLTDAYSQADPKKPIYPVKVTFATCTDYRAAISKRKMERIYDCFVHKAGGWQCTQTGESGALATKDQKEYIQKQQ